MFPFDPLFGLDDIKGKVFGDEGFSIRRRMSAIPGENRLPFRESAISEGP